VRRYLDKFNQTSDVQPQQYSHGPQPTFGEFEQVLIVRLISENTLYEVKHKLEQLFWSRASEAVSVGCTAPTISSQHAMECELQLCTFSCLSF
jgi:hypothetical protein